jgi:predicted RecA/RadA family phage recombinase
MVHVDSSGVADGLANSGDAVVVGSIVGVVEVDAAASTDLIAIKTRGVFTLNVQGTNAGGNVAVAIGDQVFIDGATGVLSKNASKTLFGVALGAVTSGNLTTNIDVKIG